MFGWPVGYILLDSAFAVAMWICLCRFFLGIALPDNSSAIVMRWLVQASTPLINAANRVCPREIPEKLRSLYAGFALLVIRFYLFPSITGYGGKGLGDFPLEETILGLF
jgi:hypothetical protein